MATDTRCKDADWTVQRDTAGNYQCRTAQLAVLMDIRDELKRLNQLLHCPNFTGMPATLRAIHRKIPARKKKI